MSWVVGVIVGSAVGDCCTHTVPPTCCTASRHCRQTAPSAIRSRAAWASVGRSAASSGSSSSSKMGTSTLTGAEDQPNAIVNCGRGRARRRGPDNRREELQEVIERPGR